MKNTDTPIAIVMGSDSDWPTMELAHKVCQEFGVSCEVQVLSAHRTPKEMLEFAERAHLNGFKVIIAGAGGAAHLPGMVASLTPLPVIGVPVQSKALSGMDSLLSIVQMPAGVPVATVAIGAGRNAGLLALQILGASDVAILEKMIRFKADLSEEVRVKNQKLRQGLGLL
ncbi:MAG: 5-(carboxyamino)imidazole ribonucleotide mutase [Verrucomicrobiales bacterium]